MQDLGLPIMADERFSEDTLFFVAEEDWRCYLDDIKGPGGIHADMVPEYLQKNFAIPRTELDMLIARQMPWSGGQSSSQVSSQPPSADQEGVLWWHSEVKARKALYEDTSPELVDLVKLCNAAEREGHGDLIWLGWNPRDNPTHRKTSLGWGSQFIAVSAAGARKMLKHFDEWFEKKHWDFSLKDALEWNPAVGEVLKASYVRPPVGTFESHYSGCTTVGTRNADVESKWIQDGTRVYAAGQKHRDLVAFSARGVPPVLRAEVQIPEEDGQDLRWFTLIDKDLQDSVSAELAASKSRHRSGKTYWSEDKPAGTSSMDDSSRWIAEVLHHPDESKWLWTENAKRHLRARIMDFKQRNWTEDFYKEFLCSALEGQEGV